MLFFYTKILTRIISSKKPSSSIQSGSSSVEEKPEFSITSIVTIPSATDRIVKQLMRVVSDHLLLPRGEMGYEVALVAATAVTEASKIALEQRERLEQTITLSLQEAHLKESILEALRQTEGKAKKVIQNIRETLSILETSSRQAPRNPKGIIRNRDVAKLQQAAAEELKVIEDVMPAPKASEELQEISFDRIRELFNNPRIPHHQAKRIFIEALGRACTNAQLILEAEGEISIEKIKEIAERLKVIQEAMSKDGLAPALIKGAEVLRMQYFIVLVKFYLRIREDALKRVGPIIQ